MDTPRALKKSVTGTGLI